MATNYGLLFPVFGHCKWKKAGGCEGGYGFYEQFSTSAGGLLSLSGLSIVSLNEKACAAGLICPATHVCKQSFNPGASYLGTAIIWLDSNCDGTGGGLRKIFAISFSEADSGGSVDFLAAVVVIAGTGRVAEKKRNG